jgi:hypothetical protein
MTQTVRHQVEALCRNSMRRHFGLITREKAMAFGMSSSAIDRRVQAGRWHRFYYGIYVDPAVPPSFNQTLLAACYTAGENAVGSHRAAAALLELQGIDERIVEITVPRGKRLPQARFRVHESTDLLPSDIIEVTRIPVTNGTRTLIDLAGVVDERSLEIALDDSFRRRLTSTDELRTRLNELSRQGRNGVGPILRLLRERGLNAHTDSGLETLIARFIRRYSLGEPTPQYVIRDGPRFVARPDFSYIPEKVALEGQSFKHHTGRVAWSRDIVRERELRRLGWEVVSITYEDLESGHESLANHIKELLAKRKPANRA